jgi:hypothetical protein
MLSSSMAWRASVKGGGPSLSCCPDAQSTLCAIVICAVRARHARSTQEEDEPHRDESGNEDTATSGRRHGSACTQPGSTEAATNTWCAGALVRWWQLPAAQSTVYRLQLYTMLYTDRTAVYRLYSSVHSDLSTDRTPSNGEVAGARPGCRASKV